MFSPRFPPQLRVSAVSIIALCYASALTGCGYIGEPLPPLANIPMRVEDLAAIQRGSRIIVHFKVPQRTTEDIAIKAPLKLDLRIGAAGQFQENEWAGRALQVPAGPVAQGMANYEIPTAAWTNQEVILGVRATGANGKSSGWSNFVSLPVVPPPDKPEDVTPTPTATGVRLTWRAHGANFRVFRKTEGVDYAAVANVQQPEWLDANSEFGKRYAYLVQTIVTLANGKEAESELSDEKVVTPEDKFPPAVPTGLRATAAPNSIELNWERNAESDLAGYRIYRAAGDGAFEKLADVGLAPSYSDRTAARGAKYRYAIAAFDQAGNESARTPAVEVQTLAHLGNQKARELSDAADHEVGLIRQVGREARIEHGLVRAFF
jgi:hypothetical protein